MKRITQRSKYKNHTLRQQINDSFESDMTPPIVFFPTEGSFIKVHNICHWTVVNILKIATDTEKILRVPFQPQSQCMRGHKDEKYF